MKIYLVEKDNGETYEDYHTHISNAFTTYRDASESLVKDGYMPYPNRSIANDELEIYFVLNTIEGDISDAVKEELRQEDIANGTYSEDYTYNYGYEMSYGAKIIEIELQGMS